MSHAHVQCIEQNRKAFEVMGRVKPAHENGNHLVRRYPEALPERRLAARMEPLGVHTVRMHLDS